MNDGTHYHGEKLHLHQSLPLQEKREQWEKMLTPIFVTKVFETTLVVLQSVEGEKGERILYHCHRYMEFGTTQRSTCEVSVDKRTHDIKEVFAWLQEQLKG